MRLSFTLVTVDYFWHFVWSLLILSFVSLIDLNSMWVHTFFSFLGKTCLNNGCHLCTLCGDFMDIDCFCLRRDAISRQTAHRDDWQVLSVRLWTWPDEEEEEEKQEEEEEGGSKNTPKVKCVFLGKLTDNVMKCTELNICSLQLFCQQFVQFTLS